MAQTGFKPISMWTISIDIIIINTSDIIKQVIQSCCCFHKYESFLKISNLDRWNSRNCRYTLYIELLSHIWINLVEQEYFIVIYKPFLLNKISFIAATFDHSLDKYIHQIHIHILLHYQLPINTPNSYHHLGIKNNIKVDQLDCNHYPCTGKQKI